MEDSMTVTSRLDKGEIDTFGEDHHPGWCIDEHDLSDADIYDYEFVYKHC